MVPLSESERNRRNEARDHLVREVVQDILQDPSYEYYEQALLSLANLREVSPENLQKARLEDAYRVVDKNLSVVQPRGWPPVVVPPMIRELSRNLSGRWVRFEIARGINNGVVAEFVRRHSITRETTEFLLTSAVSYDEFQLRLTAQANDIFRGAPGYGLPGDPAGNTFYANNDTLARVTAQREQLEAGMKT